MVLKDILKLSKVVSLRRGKSGTKISFSLKQGEKTQNLRILDRKCDILSARTLVQQIALSVDLSLAKLLKKLHFPAYSSNI